MRFLGYVTLVIIAKINMAIVAYMRVDCVI